MIKLFLNLINKQQKFIMFRFILSAVSVVFVGGCNNTFSLKSEIQRPAEGRSRALCALESRALCALERSRALCAPCASSFPFTSSSSLPNSSNERKQSLRSKAPSPTSSKINSNQKKTVKALSSFVTHQKTTPYSFSNSTRE
jgi:hypothetical protein